MHYSSKIVVLIRHFLKLLVVNVFTCTQVSTRAAGVSLQEHTFWRHLCTESGLDVVHKGLTVRAVHPDSLPQRVLNVHLKNTVHF